MRNALFSNFNPAFWENKFENPESVAGEKSICILFSLLSKDSNKTTGMSYCGEKMSYV